MRIPRIALTSPAHEAGRRNHRGEENKIDAIIVTNASAEEIAALAVGLQGRPEDLKKQIIAILKNEMSEELASSARTHEW